MNRRQLVSLLTALSVPIPRAFASDPITIVIPFAPGASADTLMRQIAQQVTQTTGQVIVIDNRPGSNGIVAAGAVKRAPPNGQTLLNANLGTNAINASLYERLPYDPLKDFAPITPLWRFPSVLAVSASSPARTAADLLKIARESPDGLTYGSAGSGSGAHLLGGLFASRAGARMVHVPYRGVAPALVDVMAGRVDFIFAGYASVITLVKAGNLRLLAVASKRRLKALPDLPTMAEAGLGDSIVLDNWFGLVAPAATPETTIRRLHGMFTTAAQTPAIVASLEEQGIEAYTSAPAEFQELIRTDIDKLGRIVKSIGAKPD